MGTAHGWSRRMVQRLGTTATVLGIVVASMIGLHDWADSASTQGAASDHGTSQDRPAG